MVRNRNYAYFLYQYGARTPKRLKSIFQEQGINCDRVWFSNIAESARKQKGDPADTMLTDEEFAEFAKMRPDLDKEELDTLREIASCGPAESEFQLNHY